MVGTSIRILYVVCCTVQIHLIRCIAIPIVVAPPAVAMSSRKVSRVGGEAQHRCYFCEQWIIPSASPHKQPLLRYATYTSRPLAHVCIRHST